MNIREEIFEDSSTELSQAQKIEIERRLNLVAESKVKYFTLEEVRDRIKLLKNRPIE